MEGLRCRAREACKAAMGDFEKLGNREKVWLAQFSEGGRLPGAVSCFGETVKLTGRAAQCSRAGPQGVMTMRCGLQVDMCLWAKENFTPQHAKPLQPWA